VHLLLTDRLTCPRCGPTFGLVLLADRLEDRVVHEGRLGCPNCRDAYPIERGFGDLRAPPRGALPPGLAGAPDRPDAPDSAEGSRLLALLGVVGGPGTLALVGEPARAAGSIAGALPEMQVVAVDPDQREWPETPRVSRLACAPGLPFFDGSLRGVAVDGRLGASWVGEAARVAAPRARVAVVRPASDARDVLESAGLRVLLSDPETVVAARS
jgi:uncharacterized protein YbaR (Trm112 family)